MERINTAATHAINALPASEAEQFRDLAEDDEYLSHHIDSFRRVAAELADGLPDIVPVASPVIWDRIADETGIYQQTAIDDVVPIKRRSLGIFTTLAAVAAALVIGVAAGSLFDASATSLRDVAVAAAAEPGATTIEMTNPAGMTGVNASAVLAADGTGYLVADSLPKLADDRTYQLWLVVDDKVVSAGLLGNDPDVTQFRAEGNIVGMAISNEVAGGVVVSEVDPVTLWLRDA